MPSLPRRKLVRAYYEKELRLDQSNLKFYKSIVWQRTRLSFLSDPDNAICVMCAMQGIATPATIVDHIIPISEGGAKLARSNMQGLCSHHHHSKSGVDGNRRRKILRTPPQS